MNRRGLVYSIAMLFITIGALVAILLIVNSTSDQLERFAGLGGQSALVLQATLPAQRLFLFVDTAAPLAADVAASDIGETGGFAHGENPCAGPDIGIMPINQPDGTLCLTPQHAVAAYLGRAGKHMDALLHQIFGAAESETIPAGNIPDNNSAFALNHTTLTGIALAPIIVPIQLPTEGKPFVGAHSVKPSFSVATSLDIFQTYSQLTTFAAAAVQQCQNLAVDKKESCVRDQIAATTLPHQLKLFASLPKGTKDLPEDAFTLFYDQFDGRQGLSVVRFLLYIPSAS